MNRLFQRHPDRTADCERVRKCTFGTDCVHGIDLRQGEIHDSIRGDDERGIAATGDEQLAKMRVRAERAVFDARSVRS